MKEIKAKELLEMKRSGDPELQKKADQYIKDLVNRANKAMEDYLWMRFESIQDAHGTKDLIQ